MADEYTADQADSDFTSGFTTTAPVTPAAGAKEPTAAEPAPAKEDGTATAASDPPAPAAAPEYVQITKGDWESVKSAANKATALESQVTKMTGTLGNVHQLVNQLKAATPQGAAVELPADLLSDLEKEYPELAPHLKGVFEKLLKGIRGTGTATAALNEEAISGIVTQAVERRLIKAEEKALNDAHKDWREIVGAVDGGPATDNAFRKWLATQDADYQAEINETDSPAVVRRAINKFKAATPPPAPKPPAPAPKNTAQADRIRGAVLPKGDGGQPAAPNTADDDFSAGFRSG